MLFEILHLDHMLLTVILPFMLLKAPLHCFQKSAVMFRFPAFFWFFSFSFFMGRSDKARKKQGDNHLSMNGWLLKTMTLFYSVLVEK